MVVHVYKTPEMVAKAAASVIAAQILEKPDTILGLATGSTPVGTYKQLIKLNEEGLLDFTDVATYNLDEYIGLDGSHDQSYRYFMNTNLFNHINIKPDNTHVPCGIGDDPEKNAADYDEMIAKAGGIDLQLLGIGHNGHIGFNEPDDEFTYATHVVSLTRSTIDANKIYFACEDDMPKSAITLGMKGILGAKTILLLALGEGKAKAVRDMVRGNMNPNCPASILGAHKNVIVIADEAAASLL